MVQLSENVFNFNYKKKSYFVFHLIRRQNNLKT